MASPRVIMPIQNGRGPVHSWCDKLASTPTVGFRMEPDFMPGDSMLEALAPMLNGLYADNRPLFTVERLEPFAISFSVENGFRYGLDATNVHVGFFHSLKTELVSGGPPQLKMLSTPAPYTALLDTVNEKVIEAILLLAKGKSRKVTRLGIVSTTSVAEDDLPPGFHKFIEYMGKPWGSEIDQYTFNVSGTVGWGDDWRDACIHTITKSADPTALMTVQLDWGRTFENGKLVNKGTLTDLTSSCSKAALAYFEKLAEGSLFDERIIHEPAQA